MSGVERCGDLGDDRHGVGGVEGSLAEQCLQVGALDVAHRDEDAPVCLSGFVDRDDVRVVERGGELGLGQEPLPEVAVLGQLGREELQGDLAASRVSSAR